MSNVLCKVGKTNGLSVEVMKRLMVAHLQQAWSDPDKFRSAVGHDYYLECRRDPGCGELLLSAYTHLHSTLSLYLFLSFTHCYNTPYSYSLVSGQLFTPQGLRMLTAIGFQDRSQNPLVFSIEKLSH